MSKTNDAPFGLRELKVHLISNDDKITKMNIFMTKERSLFRYNVIPDKFHFISFGQNGPESGQNHVLKLDLMLLFYKSCQKYISFVKLRLVITFLF